MSIRPLLIVALAAALGACATPRFDTAGVATELTPRAAVGTSAQGSRVVWGGVIVTSTNTADATQLEVLGYPIDHEQRPQSDKQAQGRFIVMHPGYLEPADYANGRAVTVKGTVEATKTGKIGEARYTYPVVEAEEIELWPREEQRVYSRPSVHFGIGIGVGNW